MKAEEFDVFVIGTGTAGQTVAFECSKAGKKVAVTDHREFGGTCPNRGCDPKKVLVGFTEVVHLANNLKEYGISGVPDIKWSSVQEFKKKFTAEVPLATEKKFKDAGIAMYHQSPEFLDKNTLLVEGKKVSAEKIVIAAGKKPRELKISGSNFLKASDDFLSLQSLPESMVFIGAGYVGMEFAHIAARCGVKVTLIEMGDRPLNLFEAEMVSHITEASQELGIQFIFGAQVTEVEKLQKNFRIFYSKKGKRQSLKARMVFNTSGRVPSINELSLEKGDVEYGDGGIAVNDYLQNPINASVYACGDVSASAGLPLTPLSGIEAKIVANNILNGNRKKLTLPPIPSAVFTIPQLASVGMTEEEANKEGHDFDVKTQSVPTWYNAKRIAESVYAYKILVDKKTDLILGAHLVSVDAAETINLFALAMKQKMKVGDFKQSIFTYPSWSNDLKSMV